MIWQMEKVYERDKNIIEKLAETKESKVLRREMQDMEKELRDRLKACADSMLREFDEYVIAENAAIGELKKQYFLRGASDRAAMLR